MPTTPITSLHKIYWTIQNITITKWLHSTM